MIYPLMAIKLHLWTNETFSVSYVLLHRRNFLTLLRIDFRVLSQNLSKIGPAGAVLEACKQGDTLVYPLYPFTLCLGRTFSAYLITYR